MRRTCRAHGFTLLELLLSLTILAVIVGMTSGALRIGVRAWEKGERDIENHQKQRIVLDLMKRQLMSASPGEFPVGDEETLRLKGDRETLEMVSQRPLSSKNIYGKVYARYEVASEEDGLHALVFYEENIALLGKDFKPDDVDEDLYHELLSGVHLVRFEYLKGDEDEEPEWREKWDPEDDEGLPMAVKIEFREAADAPPVLVIARIVHDG